MHKNIALELLKEHEGFRQKPYQCTSGKWTIGYGYNLESHGFSQVEIGTLQKEGWTQSHAERMLQHEIDLICAAFHRLPWFAALDDVRKAVVIDMTYNLGIDGFLGFRKTIAALREQDWDAAVHEMRHSKWAKQVPNRCAKLCNIMRSGTVDD